MSRPAAPGVTAEPASGDAPPRLRTGTRVAYGVADFGASLSYTAINTWLLFFLINVAGVAPLAAGAVFVAGRAFDAVLDPVMGAWLDRGRGRVRRLALVRGFAIPLGIAFALLWAVPAAGGVAALIALLAFSLLFTVVQVPYLALTPDLAPDYDQRTELTGYRVAFAILGSLVAAAVPPILVVLVAPAPSLAASGAPGWLAMGILLGAATAVPYLVTAARVPEPAARPSEPPGRRTEGRLRASVRAALGIHGFREILGSFLAITVGLMVVSSMLPFFLESALGISAGGQTLVLATFFGVAAVAFPLWSAASRRIGKRASLAIACVGLAVATLAIATLAPAGGLSAFLMVGAAGAGVALAGVMMLPWAMLPDVVEFGELAGAGRREGTVYALFTFGQKLAGSAGVFANAIAAAAFGYRQGVAAQTPETIAGIELMVGPVAAIAFAVAAALAWRVPITRASHEDARRALDARTGT